MQIIYTSGNYKRTIVKSIVAIVLGLVLVLWPTEVLNYTVKLSVPYFVLPGLFLFWYPCGIRMNVLQGD